MKAARVSRFGPPNVITLDDLPRSEPAAGQLLVRVKAAGLGNWDTLIREGTVQLQPLPLTLGSERNRASSWIRLKFTKEDDADHGSGATAKPGD